MTNARCPAWRFAWFATLAGLAQKTQAQVASVTQGCIGLPKTYGTLVGTTFAVNTGNSACSGAGYAGIGYCCSGSNMGISGAWVRGSCTLSTLPAAPILTNDPSVNGSNPMCLDVAAQTLALTPCGTLSALTPSPKQLWSWINSYGTNLYHPRSGMCVNSTMRLAPCNSAGLISVIGTDGTLSGSLSRLLTATTPPTLAAATPGYSQKWMLPCMSLPRPATLSHISSTSSTSSESQASPPLPKAPAASPPAALPPAVPSPSLLPPEVPSPNVSPPAMAPEALPQAPPPMPAQANMTSSSSSSSSDAQAPPRRYYMESHTAQALQIDVAAIVIGVFVVVAIAMYAAPRYRIA